MESYKTRYYEHHFSWLVHRQVTTCIRLAKYQKHLVPLLFSDGDWRLLKPQLVRQFSATTMTNYVILSDMTTTFFAAPSRNPDHDDSDGEKEEYQVKAEQGLELEENYDVPYEVSDEYQSVFNEVWRVVNMFKRSPTKIRFSRMLNVSSVKLVCYCRV